MLLSEKLIMQNMTKFSGDNSGKFDVNIAAQKGCQMKCQNCECNKIKFGGNVSIQEIDNGFRNALSNIPSDLKYINRVDVHFSRIGEPTWNPDVLAFIKRGMMAAISEFTKNSGIEIGKIYPTISTMMPKENEKLVPFLRQWCFIKNELFGGDAGLTISMNSTFDEQRNSLFGNKSLTILQISKIMENLPMPLGGKYILDFNVNAKTILDAEVLGCLFDKDKIVVRIDSKHEKVNVVNRFVEPIINSGWDVIIEDSSEVNMCGNGYLLL